MCGFHGGPRAGVCAPTQARLRRESPSAPLAEVGVDIRGFNWLARSALYGLRDHLKLTLAHFAVVIQAVEDDELPECFIAAWRIRGMDLFGVQ